MPHVRRRKHIRTTAARNTLIIISCDNYITDVTCGRFEHRVKFLKEKRTPEVATHFKLCEMIAHPRMLTHRLYVLSRETPHWLQSSFARIILRGLITILKGMALACFWIGERVSPVIPAQ